ncbi:MAG: bifunctional riboflavin kinase/FAD synthetase [Bdellovibrionota bacterium]
MKIFRGHAEVDQKFSCPIVTIGNFDGLHLGHRRIIEDVLKQARQKGGTSVVYTFRPHPHLALAPDEDLQLINTYDEKIDLLREIGVDVVVEEPFSREFSTNSPEFFFNDILVGKLSANTIYVGYDFGFGKNRAGSLELLKKLCAGRGIELVVTEPFKINGETCSSSRIRNYIKDGNVSAASELLGRPFFYRGLVIRGQGRGHKIGFATANVHTESKLRVKEGVYATFAVYGGKRYLSVTNVGRQPTFNKSDDAPVAVETHLFDFDQDIYGEVLEVQMVERIRDEVRFGGIDELVAQIRKDAEVAKKILARQSGQKKDKH